MIDVRSVRTVCLILLAGLSTGLARGQLTAVRQKPRLSLGISSGTSESEVEVPLTLAGPADMAVGRIEASITFPAALSFERISGYLISQNEVKAEAKAQQAEGGSEGSQLVMGLSLQPASSDKPFPPGVLASIVFKVAKGTKPDVLALGIQAKVFALADLRQEINPVELYEGRINIQEPEVFFGCFFYMH